MCYFFIFLLPGFNLISFNFEVIRGNKRSSGDETCILKFVLPGLIAFILYALSIRFTIFNLVRANSIRGHGFISAHC